MATRGRSGLHRPRRVLLGLETLGSFKTIPMQQSLPALLIEGSFQKVV